MTRREWEGRAQKASQGKGKKEPPSGKGSNASSDCFATRDETTEPLEGPNDFWEEPNRIIINWSSAIACCDDLGR